MRGGNALEPLVSCKLVKGDLRSEGSETTNSSTDPTVTLRTGQVGIVYRGIFTWVSKHIIVKSKTRKVITEIVDKAGIRRKKTLLPR
ncbi:hypothetical protein [Psychroflexus sp. MES1-P1E]|uniref:hypothetical protein n=1 Tax=Psychroflexus sp. MES1-P1E TaxID=2058320 RepID=UPI000C7A568D|nr:hypothetical protein [Psychroflexus sp. MES1-P1E]PKG42568.1 hypothetical protein CXF67_09580 [Psychroflexus sp. MES1-P1E]